MTSWTLYENLMDVQLVLFVSWFSLLTYFMQLVFFYTPTTKVPRYQYQSSGYPEFFFGGWGGGGGYQIQRGV